MKKLLHDVIELLRFFGAVCYWILQHFIYIKPGKKRLVEEKVIILGNGSSIKAFPHEKIVGYKYCCVNFFALDERLFLDIKPSYYCCIDPYFFENKTDERVKRLYKIFETIDWPMIFICLAGTKIKFKNNYIKIAYINQYYLEYSPCFSNFCMRLYKNNKAFFGFENVIIAAIFFFIISGTKQILLSGVENDWHRGFFVNKNNDLYTIDTHFYGERKILLTGKEIPKGEFYKKMYSYYRTLYQYHVEAILSDNCGVDVINTVEDSFIDTFRKENIYSFIQY